MPSESSRSWSPRGKTRQGPSLRPSQNNRTSRKPIARGPWIRREEAVAHTGTGSTDQRPEGHAEDRRETEAIRDRAGRSGPHAPRRHCAHSPPPYTPPLMATVGRGLAEDYWAEDNSGATPLAENASTASLQLPTPPPPATKQRPHARCTATLAGFSCQPMTRGPA